jgi:hypothetical protein
MVGNYRGVAILSCIAKLFEVKVYDYIFFRSNLLLYLLNTGFLRAGQLCTSYVLNCMKNGVLVDAIYTDFSKAFDKVSHRLLLRENWISWDSAAAFLLGIRSYLTGLI